MIYLDNAATTKVYPDVVKEMNKIMLENYGNPSSIHSIGEKAAFKMNDARKKIAGEIGAKPKEIYFVGSGTEADNLAIKGIAEVSGVRKRKIIISAIEHDAVWDDCICGGVPILDIRS